MKPIKITQGCPEASRLRAAWYGADEAQKPAKLRALTAHMRGCPTCQAVNWSDFDRLSEDMAETPEMRKALDDLEARS